jgi:hypothetical protein
MLSAQLGVSSRPRQGRSRRPDSYPQRISRLIHHRPPHQSRPPRRPRRQLLVPSRPIIYSPWSDGWPTWSGGCTSWNEDSTPPMPRRRCPRRTQVTQERRLFPVLPRLPPPSGLRFTVCDDRRESRRGRRQAACTDPATGSILEKLNRGRVRCRPSLGFFSSSLHAGRMS